MMPNVFINGRVNVRKKQLDPKQRKQKSGQLRFIFKKQMNGAHDGYKAQYGG